MRWPSGLAPALVGLWAPPFAALPGPLQHTAGVGLGLLVAILLVAGGFRLAQLGWSEFQGDEALVTWASARAIAGEDAILYEHGKSPAEVLLPAVWWSLDGRLYRGDGAPAVCPGRRRRVVAGALLATRLFGRRAAWIAGALFAINGYFIAFSRVVQYQSRVIALGTLAVYAAYRALEDDYPPSACSAACSSAPRCCPITTACWSLRSCVSLVAGRPRRARQA